MSGTWARARGTWEQARRRWWVRWGVDLLLIGLVFVAVSTWQTRRHARAGTPAPDFTLRTLSGDTVSLESLRGRPVVLAFWAPWCGVCGAESSNLSQLRKLAGDSAHVVSVAVAYEDTADVQRFVDAHGVDYPVLLGDDALQRTWRVDVFPTVYFLSPEGHIQRSVVGYTTLAGLSWRWWL
ncbi:TlpA family protein disulfide reductase [Myxococcus sp. K15C18031901]|uniref:TlpA disulfide reductase family protein n=1 Tax=Myxococcus dinghuensis TaxID=2906761 RepID=UPI0020A7FE5D|nr:TlpA disulfide reductase family protein [Myxococcus dinghuensis]MCP3101494.1 TlpA family protein disulfide reductase [Myxococcus dinghuensis]